MKRLALTLTILSCSLLMSPSSHADWVKGIFSSRAHIDSLNRFLVVSDTQTVRPLGWSIVPLGDINSDQTTDVLLTRNLSDPFVDNPAYLVYGGAPPDDKLDDLFMQFMPDIWAIGDVNGDGFTDLSARLVDSLTAKVDQAIYFGGLELDDTPDFIFPQRFSWYTKAADIDDDGALDFALISTSHSDSYVYIYRVDSLRDTIPEYIIPDTSNGFGDNIITGDFNGDNYLDLAIAAFLPRDSNFVKFYWGGPDFDTIPDFEIYSFSPQFGMIMVYIPDFNGDGYGDIFISGGADDPYGIYFGGPLLDNKVDLVVNTARLGGGFEPPSSDAYAGDINSDGFSDLVWGYINPNAFINEFHLHLGGADLDSVMLADAYFENLMIPGGQNFLGQKLAGIGDFNGDGLDDFAVRSQTARTGPNWIGEVNFFAGWRDIVTDVEIEHDPALPETFQLKQNYPNPFNPETTIEFSLTQRSEVQLVIYNTLGQRVNTILDGTYSAGEYRIRWNGTDDNGKQLASGMYFYKLQTPDIAQSRKMIMLK